MQLAAIIRRNPFARLLVFYMAGILLALYVEKPIHMAIPVMIIISLVILLIFLCRHPGYHTGWLSGTLAGLILFVTGIVNMKIHDRYGNILEQSSHYAGIALLEIDEPPVITEKSVKVTARMKFSQANGIWNRQRQKILVYLEKDTASSHLLPGEYIVGRVRLARIAPPMNPGEFNYRRYLAGRGIVNQTYLAAASWQLTGQRGRSLKTTAYHIQQSLLEKYQEIGLNGTLYSILSALTLGYKSDLEVHTRQVFSQAGVMHVMALSGFNVAVIAFAMNYLLVFFERFRRGRIIKTLMIILVIWMFAFLTGLSPSVTRAAVMISLVMTGTAVQRRINTTNILYASAFILLTFSPVLIADVSFQLSFAAVFGIIMYHPPLYRLLSFRYTVTRKIWQLFTVSCAAQLATLPFTLYYFHQFPVYFWLTNLYVVPLVSIIICVAGIFLLVSFISPLMIVTGKLLEMLLSILYKGVAFTEVLPFSLIRNIHIDGTQTELLIILILFSGLYLLRRQRYYITAALCVLAILQITSLRRLSCLNRQEIFMVGNCKGISVISLISGRNCILLGDDRLSPDDRRLQYALGNFWVEYGVAGHIQYQSFRLPGGQMTPRLGDNLLFEFSGRKFMVLNDETCLKWRSDHPLKVDILVITGEIKPDLPVLTDLLEASKIIIDSSVSYYRSEEWLKQCTEMGVDCWIVSRQGAFLVKYL
jgi:competence protein ComEC